MYIQQSIFYLELNFLLTIFIDHLVAGNLANPLHGKGNADTSLVQRAFIVAQRRVVRGAGRGATVIVEEDDQRVGQHVIRL